MERQLIALALLLLATFGIQKAKAQYFSLNTNFNSPNSDSRSANWVDLDNDGFLDIFITNGKSGGQNNMAYINNGQGGFIGLIPSPLASKIVKDSSSSVASCWADTDGNPGLELFVANWYNQRNLYYRDTNQTGRVLMSNAPPTNNNSYSEGGAFGDYDQDGYVDLIVTNSAVNKRNDLFHNNGDGTFSRVTNSPIYQAFSTSRGINWTDVDNDGDLDVYITNEGNENNELYINNSGQFIKNTTASIVQFGGNSMSSCWGDYDNDGDLDVFISNHGSNNKLFRNDGNLLFTEITSSPVTTDGGFSFSANWGDVDNDGDLDLVVGNAFASSSSTRLNNFFYLNDGDGSFTKNTTDTLSQVQGWTYGNAFGDYDKDGDLDLLNANCFSGTEENHLFRNLSSDQTNPNMWTVIELEGSASNRSAIGAKVWLKAGIFGSTYWQLREVSSQSSYCGQNMLAAHFGLGNARAVDSIKVEWPSGHVDSFGLQNVNRHWKLIEGQGLSTGLEESQNSFNELKLYPNPTRSSVQLEFTVDKPSKIEINLFDLNGKHLLQLGQDIGVNGKVFKKRIDLTNLVEGVYLLRISDGNDSISKKLIIGS